MTSPHDCTYDLIIIGGGPSSAGLLHGILTQIVQGNAVNNIRIAVVERGGKSYDEGSSSNTHFEHEHELTLHLHHWFHAAHYTSQPNIIDTSSPTVLHASTPQSFLHDRILDVPTGRGWGGSTNIHAGLFIPPQSSDFDTWPGDWKERIMKGADHVMDVLKKESAIEVFPSYKVMAEVNGDTFEPITTSSARSYRVNYYSVLVGSLLQKHPELSKCVSFQPQMEVERILIRDNSDSTKDNETEGPQAWGVECAVASNKSISENSREKECITLKAKSQIILCAGAIGTPSILLASGIGHEDDLIAAGITPWYERVTGVNESKLHRYLGVGRNLRDHILVPRIFLTKEAQDESSLSYNSIRGLYSTKLSNGRNDCDRFQLQLTDGVLVDTILPHFGAGSIRRKWSFFGWQLPQVWVTIAFYILRGYLQFMLCIVPGLKKWLCLHFTSVNVCLMNPKSVGTVSLLQRQSPSSENSSSRLSDHEVVVDPGYLSNSHDMNALWRCWKSLGTLKIPSSIFELLPGYCFIILFNVYRFGAWIVSWLRMLLFVNTDNLESEDNAIPSWFPSYVTELAVPYYHWCGTCAMGPVNTMHQTINNEADDFVVDEFLCLRGISELRICDASVFADCITAPTALTCAALGFSASEIILNDVTQQ